MTVKMDKMSTPSSRELAQQLFEKNVELENKRRRSAQARVPSDPNAWQQMRENYEAIILEDHAFSEEHSIEYALWQLHYRQIEEFRAHFNAALTSAGPNASQGGKAPSRPNRISKIRLQFKTFLSEAIRFYHDLVLKIRAKYGLPLGYFSEDSQHHTNEKGGNKSAEVKKGLISCHRCLIYLGDLARYNGLYVEGDSKSRDYAAASNYYLQAASIWPSSGNPHHQLAILASYDGDELVAIYWYFRSLAVDFPFSTARDNLIVAFEKNRQNYTQLPRFARSSAPKEPNVWVNGGKGRGKKSSRFPYKDTSVEDNIAGNTLSSAVDTYKAFCIRFVRLNGILFTRTSLETFEEVLSSAAGGLLELLSSGTEVEVSFGEDALDNGLVVVRVISILIFTVHNVNRQAEGQTYAEILQRNVLLQNAFCAVFEFMASILNRCAQLLDPSSSYLLPGILVFLEWLACSPDVATGSDVDEKQEAVRSVFWNHYISFVNKLISDGLVPIDDDEDESCFFNMSRYEDGENENQLALWEDFELRGFLPILPAQTILDFSRKHFFANDRNKEKKVRVQRVLAAGKALKNTVRFGQKTICFDSKTKKFVIGVESQKPENLTTSSLTTAETDGLLQGMAAEKIDLGILESKTPFIAEEEEEVIVFRPTVSEKQADAIGHGWVANDNPEPNKIASADDFQFNSALVNLHQHAASCSGLPPPAAVDSVINPPPLANGFNCLNISEGLGISQSDPFLHAIQQPVNSNAFGQTRVLDAVVPSKGESAVKTDGSTFPPPLRNPVSRPVRHLGPPPGFGQVAPKQVNTESDSDLKSENPLMDDYRWLDGYQLPESLTGSGLRNSIGQVSGANTESAGKSYDITGTMGFPFPGKQVPTMEFQMEKLRVRQGQQQFENGNQQLTSVPGQYKGSSIWTGQYFV